MSTSYLNIAFISASKNNRYIYYRYKRCRQIFSILYDGNYLRSIEFSGGFVKSNAAGLLLAPHKSNRIWRARSICGSGGVYADCGHIGILLKKYTNTYIIKNIFFTAQFKNLCFINWTPTGRILPFAAAADRKNIRQYTQEPANIIKLLCYNNVAIRSGTKSVVSRFDAEVAVSVK